MNLKADRVADLLEEPQDPEDPLIITPEPDLRELRKSGAASIDLRLGTWFLKLRQTRSYEQQVTRELSGLTKHYYVPFGAEFILHPRTFVLGVTLEWIRLSRNLGGYVVGRSSWGRRGLIIATAIGVHPGFTGCLTLELTNVGEVPFPITPGQQICQLFLHQVTDSAQIDTTAFVGLRRPILGSIRIDEIAKKLAEADKG